MKISKWKMSIYIRVNDAFAWGPYFRMDHESAEELFELQCGWLWLRFNAELFKHYPGQNMP